MASLTDTCRAEPPINNIFKPAAMVTTTTALPTSARVGAASNNSAADVGATSRAKTHGPSNTIASPQPELCGTDHATEMALTLDDVRARTFPGLDDESRPRMWRILLGVVDCEHPSTQPTERRAQYHRWRHEFQSFRLQYHESLGPEEYKPTEESQTTSGTSKDQQHRLVQDAALMREIDKDVNRTQSGMRFFSDGGIHQQWMLRILFVYAKIHPDPGYMQGMNEILATIVFVFASDGCDAWASEAEPDAFYAFSEVMSSVKLLYNKSPSDPTKTGVDMQMTRLAVLLRQHDAPLWQHLNSIGLTPDFYSFRWYMTLLAREFRMATTLRIWDALFADPKRFSFVHYVSLALLRSQRAAILREGFSGALKILQALQLPDVEPMLAQAQQMREQDRQTDRRRVSIPMYHFELLGTSSGEAKS